MIAEWWFDAEKMSRIAGKGDLGLCESGTPVCFGCSWLSVTTVVVRPYALEMDMRVNLLNKFLKGNRQRGLKLLVGNGNLIFYLVRFLSRHAFTHKNQACWNQQYFLLF